MRTDESERKYPIRLGFVTTEEMAEGIAAASAQALTSQNAWLRAPALEKLKREKAA